MPAPHIASLATPPPTPQQGAVLIVALVILLIMTVIGVSAMQVTVLEEKMAGSLRDKSIAFEAAEAALRDAEGVLSQAMIPNPSSTNGWYEYGQTQLWPIVSWTNSSQAVQYSGPTLDNVARLPAYIIEELRPGNTDLEAGLPQQVDYYRISARGIGGGSAVVILQSVFKR